MGSKKKDELPLGSTIDPNFRSAPVGPALREDRAALDASLDGLDDQTILEQCGATATKAAAVLEK